MAINEAFMNNYQAEMEKKTEQTQNFISQYVINERKPFPLQRFIANNYSLTRGNRCIMRAEFPINKTIKIVLLGT